jgi:hypothetical protein
MLLIAAAKQLKMKITYTTNCESCNKIREISRYAKILKHFTINTLRILQ